MKLLFTALIIIFSCHGFQRAHGSLGNNLAVAIHHASRRCLLTLSTTADHLVQALYKEPTEHVEALAQVGGVAHAQPVAHDMRR